MVFGSISLRYVGLEEFEGIKATLAHEVVPTRRYFMSEYRPPQEVEPLFRSCFRGFP